MHFDVVPKEIPDVGLGRAGLGDEIAPDLDMGPIKHRAARCCLLDQRNEAGHLGVINLASSAHALHLVHDQENLKMCLSPPTSPRSSATNSGHVFTPARVAHILEGGNQFA